MRERVIHRMNSKVMLAPYVPPLTVGNPPIDSDKLEGSI